LQIRVARVVVAVSEEDVIEAARQLHAVFLVWPSPDGTCAEAARQFGFVATTSYGGALAAAKTN